MMKIRFKNLKEILFEAAQTASSLPHNVKLAEAGDKYNHAFFLVDENKLPDIEQALIGGISFTDMGGRWGVNSVNAVHGYGPLLYRLAMGWVGQEMKRKSLGRGLHRSAETSRQAKKVWNRFAKQARDTESGITYELDDEYTAKQSELPLMRKRKVELTAEQLDVARNMLWSLNIAK